MKKSSFWIVILAIAILMVGCDSGFEELIPPNLPVDGEPVEDNTAGEAVQEPEPVATIQAEDSELVEPEIVEPPEESEAGDTVGQSMVASFVPVTVEELGIETQVPAEWPKIENDDLLEHAWGPGQYTFIAFYVVPGDDSQAAMAELLNATPKDLAAGMVEGTYTEEHIGQYDWSLYVIENPDVNLIQSVSMTTQDSSVYVVSLFVESNDQEAIMSAALENFAVNGNQAAYSSPQSGEASSSLAEDLAGTSWVMTTYNDGSGQMVDVLTGQIITAVFDTQGRLSGFAGCNNYGTLFSTEGDQLIIQQPVFTDKTCSEPEGIMLQETSFLADMANIVTFKATENELLLFDEAGELLLTFWSP